MQSSHSTHENIHSDSKKRVDGHRRYRVSGEALIATYIAVSFTILLLVPYRSDGFLGIPAPFFSNIADRTHTNAGPFIIYALFFLSTVVLAGLRLLIGFESLEGEGDFEDLAANSKPWRRVVERSVRIMTLVFVEALLLFAKVKGPGVIVALVTASMLAVSWNFIIFRMATHSLSSAKVKHYCRERVSKWLRWDILCLFGQVLCLVVVYIAKPNPSAQELTLVGAAVLISAFTLIAFVFDLVDHYRSYRHSLKVAVPLSAVLAVLFLAILALSGTPFEALSGL
jgi:hypothetical protein